MSTAAGKLTDQKVLIFDVYATLIDWEEGIYHALLPLLDAYPTGTGTGTDLSSNAGLKKHRWTKDEALLAFAGVERDIQTRFPEMLYCDVLERAYVVLENKLREECGSEVLDLPLELVGGRSVGERGESGGEAGGASASDTAIQGNKTPQKVFAESIRAWPIFADTCEALRTLSKYFKLVVLSNVDRTSFGYTHALLSEGNTGVLKDADLLPVYLSPTSAAVEGEDSTSESRLRYRKKYWFPQLSEGSKSPFSLIMTAQDTGAYKPALEGFLTTLEVIRTDPLLLGDQGLSLEDVKKKTMSVAKSIPHDIVPAGKLGMKSVWIERPGTGAATGTSGSGEEGVVWTWKCDTLGDFARAVEEELGVRTRT
ncbi:hypothetical protein AX16_008198 [Volvariella volvacea WC 439]|nr:hypothetical protein AX16_008198 [Volvariella volvacea WC 439]